MRLLYRMRQFWHTLFVKTDPLTLERGLALLNPDQAALFLQLQADEKGHALSMMNKLIEQGDRQPDLLVAAMLHDVGKLRYRLTPLDRAIIVLAKTVIPGMVQKWGSMATSEWDGLPRWQKPFVIAEQHASWGAEMVQKCGANPLIVTLVREHHHPHVNNITEMENNLLYKLWAVDNNS